MAGGHGKHRQFLLHEGFAVRSHHSGVGAGVGIPCNVLVVLIVATAMHTGRIDFGNARSKAGICCSV